MIDKEQYRRTFGALHASGDFLKEASAMKNQKHFSPRRAVLLCAAVILIVAMASVCYAANVGGIRRTIQIYVHGDQTNAVFAYGDGNYTMTYTTPDGESHEQGGGGVAYDAFGNERPLTEEELLETVDNPEVSYDADGTVWVYYKSQVKEITDLFNEDGVCFLQLKDGKDTLYLTIKRDGGFAWSSIAYVQPDELT